MFDYPLSVEQEYKRLQKLGWPIWVKDDKGVRISSGVNPDTISFPSDAWDSSGENAEHDGFWAQHRADVIYKHLIDNEIDLMWEIGAGAGNATIPISERGIPVIGVEPLYAGAVNIANARLEAFAGTFEQLNLPESSIRCIGMFDVLEHIENPKTVLRKIKATLSTGGIFIASVPAHQWLFSDFDISAGHFKRYSRKSIKQLLEDSGFEVLAISEIFGFLILPALVFRKIPHVLHLRPIEKSAKSGTKATNKFLDTIYRLILSAEAKTGVPMGLSIIILAKKPNQNLS